MRVAVVGGGIQGCAVALELAGRGVQVTLYERRERLLDAASRHTEGKIHLGFVYAADDSLRTARLMARGAAAFAPAMQRWIGARAGGVVVSRPFHYAVHRRSMRTPDALAATYARVGEVIRQEIAAGAYFGVDDPGSIRRLTGDEAVAFGPDAAAVFATEEVAVEPDALADALAAAVARHDGIAVRTATRVTGADPATGQLRIADADGERETARFAHVANCAWCGRLELDGTAGVEPPPRWSFRMKYFGRAPLSADAPAPPSTTIVLGPFGDVVDYGDGSAMFSWYPVGRRGWSADPAPPEWPSSITGEDAHRLTHGIAAGLSGVVPGVGRALLREPERVRVRGGVIYARGDTDVDDAASELHERHRVGVFTHGVYHSVDTGKYTLAPLFALQLADRITGRGRG
jgi:glycine/D-amino acid oxidase-like deaminating enzyme